MRSSSLSRGLRFSEWAQSSPGDPFWVVAEPGSGTRPPEERSFGVRSPARQAVIPWAASGHRVAEGALTVPSRD